jgi:hypothetical protein
MATAQSIMDILAELVGGGRGTVQPPGPTVPLTPPPMAPWRTDAVRAGDPNPNPESGTEQPLVEDYTSPLGALQRLFRNPSALAAPFGMAADALTFGRMRVPPLAPRTPPPGEERDPYPQTIVPEQPFTTEVRPEPDRLPPGEEQRIVTGATAADRMRPPPFISGQRPDQRGFGDYALAFLSGLSGEGGLREVRRLSESERGRNATYDAIIERGGSEALARAITENPAMFAPILPSLFTPRTRIVNNRLVDVTTGRLIADFSSHILKSDERLVTGTGQEIARGGPRRLTLENINQLGERGDAFRTLSRLTQSWDNNFSFPNFPLAGDIRDWFGRNTTLLGPQGRRAAEWWQSYRRDAEIIERHGIFGATLTGNELEAWRAADITPNMAPDIIRRNLERRNEIMVGVLRRRAAAYVEQGYDLNSIASAFGVPADLLTSTGPQTPPPAGAQPPPGAQPTPSREPRRIATDEEYNALPPGTRFIGPDGRTRIKP